METLYIAIISVCISAVHCNSHEHWVKYISEPFAVENAMVKGEQDFMPYCSEQIELLKANLTEEQKKRSVNALCVKKEIWDRNNPDSYQE